MYSNEKLENARENLRRSQRERKPYYIDVLNAKFLVHPDVFSPKYFKSTEIVNSRFPFRENERILEIGCGVGVTSILAAKIYRNKVVAVDINPEAVRLTRENAEINGVSSLVDARPSDVFSSIRPNERFDTIYWDLPFIYVPPDYKYSFPLEQSVCDPGYKTTKTFVVQAHRYLEHEGRLFVGFGSNGDYDKFEIIANANDYNVFEEYQGSIEERGGLTYRLLRLDKKRDHHSDRRKQVLESIFNYRQISDNIATSGQPSETELTKIAHAGYEVVINLGLSDSYYALSDEKGTVKTLGLKYIHIPVEWDMPKRSDFNEFLEAMANNQGHRIFVHCAANKRVSVFVSLFQSITLAWSKQKTLAEIKETWEPNDVWSKLIDDILETSKG